MPSYMYNIMPHVKLLTIRSDHINPRKYETSRTQILQKHFGVVSISVHGMLYTVHVCSEW